MKIFLPCINSCADAMDTANESHLVTLLFFSFLVKEREKLNLRFKACFSPAYQKRIYDSIIEAMNEEWMDKEADYIKTQVQAVQKVHSALELEGKHLDATCDITYSLFELARYLNDEDDVYIVTNYTDNILAQHKSWSTQSGSSSAVLEFEIITPSQAILLISELNKEKD